jgi:hypothetical protein
MRRRLATTALLLAGVIAGAIARPGVPAEIVDAADASAHVGSAVTVEGDVATARSDADGLVLELAPLGEKSFRAVLVRSLISSLPRSPERIYEGKRVRVTGRVQRFAGRPEMVLESASQIEIVDVAGAPATTAGAPPAAAPPPAATPLPAPTTAAPAPTGAGSATAAAPGVQPRAAAPAAPATSPAPPSATTAPAAPPMAPGPPAVAAPSTAAPPPAAAPSAVTPPPPAPEPAPKPLLAERLAAQACERARARWTEAAARTRAAAAELTRCLDTASFACRESAAKLAPALGDLEWAEQQVADRCD